MNPEKVNNRKAKAKKTKLSLWMITKNRQELSDDQLDLVAGGGTKAAEEFLEKLMKEKGVERWDLFDHMTPEEYQHYVNLYNDTPETPTINLFKIPGFNKPQ